VVSYRSFLTALLGILSVPRSNIFSTAGSNVSLTAAPHILSGRSFERFHGKFDYFLDGGVRVDAAQRSDKNHVQNEQ
jgi:hypothetical protein